MSDFNSLLTTANYAELMQAIKDIMEKQAKLDLSEVSNIPAGTMRINPSTKVFEKFNGTTWEAFTSSEIEALQTAVAGKEPVISPKNTGFNLDKSDSYTSDSSATLATSKAVKDGLATKSATDHAHSGVYEPVIVKKSGFNLDKSDSYTVSDTNKLATSKALIDGLGTKVTNSNDVWHDVTFLNGWMNTNEKFSVTTRQDCQYKKDSLGNVHIRGDVSHSSSSASSSTIFVLPSGYRSLKNRQFVAVVDGNMAAISVLITGEVQITFGGKRAVLGEIIFGTD